VVPLELDGGEAEAAGGGEHLADHHQDDADRQRLAHPGDEDAVLIGRGAQWTGGTRLAERRNLALQRKPTPAVSDLWPDPTEPVG
jgi:hypothetical protein